jgi:enoyl-CoA hydratase/carnithine racemase
MTEAIDAIGRADADDEVKAVILAGAKTRSLLCAPLRTEGGNVGVIKR